MSWATAVTRGFLLCGMALLCTHSGQSIPSAQPKETHEATRHTCGSIPTGYTGFRACRVSLPHASRFGLHLGSYSMAHHLSLFAAHTLSLLLQARMLVWLVEIGPRVCCQSFLVCLLWLCLALIRRLECLCCFLLADLTTCLQQLSPSLP